MESAVSMIPGIIPAMNSALMDCSVASPYRTKITLGGISMARVPAAATLAVERESVYLNVRISCRARLPMVAQVAVLEPQTAPNRPPATWLAMANQVAGGLFGAVCGSSTATCATIGSIALPAMRKFKYADSLSTASVAAAGTMPILIPPSVIFVLYGLATEQSISALFMAGIIPGIML